MTAAKDRGARRVPSFGYNTIFGLGRELGLSPQDTKEMAYSLVGKDSLKQFTQSEINEVCYELLARKDGEQRRAGRLSDRQLYKIREYERLLGWDGDPSRLASFVEKFYKVTVLKWLTPAQAAKLIESLKAMYERMRREANV